MLLLVATIIYMDNIEAVGIKDFGNSVSAFIRKAMLGVRVLISDRGRVVAQLTKPDTLVQNLNSENIILSKWSAEGLIKLGSNKPLTFPRGEPLLKISTDELLNQLREEK